MRNTRLGERESIADVARSLSRWVQGIVARVFSQEALDTLAAHASVPVINALSDLYHPCQTFADFFTLEEKIRLHSRRKTRLYRRRQQRVPFVDDCWIAHGRACADRDARGLRGLTRKSSRRRAAMQPPRREPLNYSARLRKPFPARKRFTPTSGPAWARKARRKRAPPFSRRIK